MRCHVDEPTRDSHGIFLFILAIDATLDEYNGKRV